MNVKEMRPEKGAEKLDLQKYSDILAWNNARTFSRKSRSKLLRVKRTSPCSICGKPDWCGVSEDGTFGICMRVPAGAVSEAKNGGYIHVLQESDSTPSTPLIITTSLPVNSLQKRADIVRRHAIYSDLLESLILTARHSNDLLRRGLSDTEIARNRYASLPESPIRILSICHSLAARHDLANVPGFYRNEDDRWAFPVWRPGYFIPVRDERGRIQACQIRQDTGIRYVWLSSRDKTDGASSGTPIHFARPWRVRSTRLAIITEGALKADIIAESLDTCVIAVAGVSSFRENFGSRIRKRLPYLQKVFLAFDNDWHTKSEVLKALTRMQNSLVRSGLSGGFLDWDGSKGLDDYLKQEGLV